MEKDFYSKETIDSKLDLIHELVKSVDVKVDKIDLKQTYTNGKVRRHEKILLVVGTAIIVLLIVSGSKFTDLVTAIIGI
jgi:hypothetical protein